jgi:hypothetical protein
VHAITVLGGGYTLTSTAGTLSLGGGGLTIEATGASPRTTIGIPLTFAAGQIWKLGRGLIALDGAVGAWQPLTVHMTAGTTLRLAANFDVGNLNLVGPSGPGSSKARIILDGGDFNTSDGTPVSVADVALAGSAVVGPLSGWDTALTVGRGPAGGTGGPGTLQSVGDVSLAGSSSVTFDDLRSATSAGTGYPQLVAAGNVSLGSAALQLDTACGTSVGDTFTIVQGSSVSGTFTIAGGRTVADDDVIRAVPVGARCRSYFKITYTRDTVVATQVAPPA